MNLGSTYRPSPRLRRVFRALATVAVDQRGQVLPLSLMLLLICGLLVVSGLALASTGLKAGGIIENNTKAIYAADAGAELTVWHLKNNPPLAYPATYQIPDINGFAVTSTIEMVEALYGIEMTGGGVHSDRMEIDGSIDYDSGLGLYVYTLTVTNKDVSNIFLEKVVVMLPIGFAYAPDSTTGDFTSVNPAVRGTPEIGVVLEWDFAPPRPRIDGAPNPSEGIYTVATQTFHVTEDPGYSGDAGYMWIIAEREDIGLVGSPTYRITSTAAKAGAAAAVVKAGVLQDPGTGAVLVSSWEINPVLE